MDNYLVGSDLAPETGPLQSDATPTSADQTTSVMPVILCGGAGTRLWPVSREGFPKQFWPVLSDKSMLQETALRAIGQLPDGTRFGKPLVVCNAEHRFVIGSQLQDAGVADACIVLEPAGRNSAPAIAAAALIAAAQDPDVVLWIMPADAMIDDQAALHRTLSTAVLAAKAGRIVTFGISPSGPETGFGYIEVGTPVLEADGAFDVARFLEKPDHDTAVVFAASGGHLWNSGMFIATAGTLLSEYQLHAPEVLAHVTESIVRGKQDADFVRLEEESFSSCPSISFDYALAEKTERAAVVPAVFGWSDVGTWAAVWANSPKDARGNVLIGDAMVEGADRCLVRTDGRLTAVVGLTDAVLVVTEDAVLALHRDHAQNVKRIVERLKGQKRSEAVAHHRSLRPWGHYETLALEGRFQVKRIVVEPGQKLSLQKHFHRAEHWVVVSGSAMVTRDEERFLLSENESVYLPLGCTHRLENVGRVRLVLIEVQVGSYLGEDDIVRMEDQYGR